MDIRTMITKGYNLWRPDEECPEAIDTVTTVPVCAPNMKTTGMGRDVTTTRVGGMQVRVRGDCEHIPTIRTHGLPVLPPIKTS